MHAQLLMDVPRGSLIVEIPKGWNERAGAHFIHHEVPLDDIRVNRVGERTFILWDVLRSPYRRALLDQLHDFDFPYREGTK